LRKSPPPFREQCPYNPRRNFRFYTIGDAEGRSIVAASSTLETPPKSPDEFTR
jgi:hypothetical protein